MVSDSSFNLFNRNSIAAHYSDLNDLVFFSSSKFQWATKISLYSNWIQCVSIWINSRINFLDNFHPSVRHEFIYVWEQCEESNLNSMGVMKLYQSHWWIGMITILFSSLLLQSACRIKSHDDIYRFNSCHWFYRTEIYLNANASHLQILLTIVMWLGIFFYAKAFVYSSSYTLAPSQPITLILLACIVCLAHITYFTDTIFRYWLYFRLTIWFYHISFTHRNLLRTMPV